VLSKAPRDDLGLLHNYEAILEQSKDWLMARGDQSPSAGNWPGRVETSEVVA
jgi:hypothetical protein